MTDRFETSLIGQFRDFYSGVDGAVEIPFVSLVSSHDPSIRFTNSTTSVMKPLLKSPLASNETVFLAQPALGSQGLDYWVQNKKFGRFASYFISLGALYPVDNGVRALEDALTLVESWGVDRSAVSVHAHAHDEDLLAVAREVHNSVLATDDEGQFRHVYGDNQINGRNLNIMAYDGSGYQQTFANITKIIKGGEEVAWEVSFDSSTAAAVVHGLDHAVEAHLSRRLLPVTSADIAKNDFESVIASLFLEGLEPKSRGRNRTLRRFLSEYIRLSELFGTDFEVVGDQIFDACKTEFAMRSSLGSAAPSNIYSTALAQSVISEWLPRFRPT